MRSRSLGGHPSESTPEENQLQIAELKEVSDLKCCGLTMNMLLCFSVTEERQVKSADIKLNLDDDIAAGEESKRKCRCKIINF